MDRRHVTFLAVVVAVVGWQAPGVADDDQRLITVNGHAEIRVVPDEVVLTLGFETFDPNLSTAKSENDTRVSGVIGVAEELGIPRERIRTEYLSIEPEYGSDYKRRFLHYLVRRTMAITLRDMDRFETLLSKALEAGANYVHGVDFRTTELRKYRDQARALAIEAAREKAEALAGEVGESVGRVENIQEGSANWWSWYGSSWGPRWRGGPGQNVVQNVGGSSGGQGPTAPGQITVDARVTVTFLLEE